MEMQECLSYELCPTGAKEPVQSQTKREFRPGIVGSKYWDLKCTQSEATLREANILQQIK